ncbi:BCAM0308 family protein [Emcibacter sp.]|uniref:BCAM0308 family protein n=1 Tax=Emcibacter sp. TaxID=1979954 RepID=UPI003A904532
MSGKEGDVTHRVRGDRLIREEVHDPYRKRGKPAEPTVCPSCEVVFSKGRWHWSEAKPEGAHEEFCPACQRIRDKAPAGFLTLKGDFLEDHRQEIMNLVHNKVEQEMQEHPNNRIMSAEDQEDGSLLLTFTDVHLPRGVGEAIRHAYQGDLEINAPKDEYLVRVSWER